MLCISLDRSKRTLNVQRKAGGEFTLLPSLSWKFKNLFKLDLERLSQSDEGDCGAARTHTRYHVYVNGCYYFYVPPSSLLQIVDSKSALTESPDTCYAVLCHASSLMTIVPVTQHWQ